jgi:hypothetical protein
MHLPKPCDEISFLRNSEERKSSAGRRRPGGARLRRAWSQKINLVLSMF